MDCLRLSARRLYVCDLFSRCHPLAKSLSVIYPVYIEMNYEIFCNKKVLLCDNKRRTSRIKACLERGTPCPVQGADWTRMASGGTLCLSGEG